MSRLGIGVKAVEELYIHKFFFIVARVHVFVIFTLLFF